jgi:hypothetical protein
MAHRVSPEVTLELDDIWLYVARNSGSMDIADRLIDSITSRFHLIVSFPDLGRRRDWDLKPGIHALALRVPQCLYPAGSAQPDLSALSIGDSAEIRLPLCMWQP